MDHPLPVGTRISYADISPRVNGTIVANNQNDFLFWLVLERYNAKYHWPRGLASIPITDLDYVIVIDGDPELLPVQAGGIEEPVSAEEHEEAMR